MPWREESLGRRRATAAVLLDQLIGNAGTTAIPAYCLCFVPRRNRSSNPLPKRAPEKATVGRKRARSKSNRDHLCANHR